MSSFVYRNRHTGSVVRLAAPIATNVLWVPVTPVRRAPCGQPLDDYKPGFGREGRDGTTSYTRTAEHWVLQGGDVDLLAEHLRECASCSGSDD